MSSELNIRNYFSYDILGKVQDRILIYRDKGFTKQIDVFNSEMEHTMDAELQFEKKKIDVFTISGQDSTFQILYGFFENDTMIIKQRTYDQRVIMVDSSTLVKIPKKLIRKRFTHAVSKDKSKILLSTKDDKEQHMFYLYDTNLKKIVWQQIFVIAGQRSRNFRDILLTDSGRFFMVIQNNDSFEKDIQLLSVNPFTGLQYIINFDFKDFQKREFYIDYDNGNDELAICGTYAEKRGKEIKGFYLIKKSIDQLQVMESPTFIPFQERLYEDILQGKKRKSKVLDDLSLKELVFRNDGGVLLISEIKREFSRRNPYNTTSYPRDNYNPYTRRGWVDFYNDDIVITNINPDKEMDWYKVLYKKQFSQDDDGVFSSFFVMKTPSRMRFIYNDEIKRNNTVSEYLMDPAGKIARNSLLSTMGQEMKLRFQDAIQISSNSIIIPSEKNYDLNLVKITY